MNQDTNQKWNNESERSEVFKQTQLPKRTEKIKFLENRKL